MMGLIANVWLWQNSMVMVFGQDGQQLAEFQGELHEVWARIEETYTPADPPLFHGLWPGQALGEAEARAWALESGLAWPTRDEFHAAMAAQAIRAAIHEGESVAPAAPIPTYYLPEGDRAILCLRCGHCSHLHSDRVNRWCAFCKRFHQGEPAATMPVVGEQVAGGEVAEVARAGHLRLIKHERRGKL